MISANITNEEMATLSFSKPGVTLDEVLKESGLKSSEAAPIVAAKADGVVLGLGDTLTPQDDPYEIEFLTTDSEDGISVFWHTTCHVMTQAVKRIFGQKIPLGVGPPTEDGFYQDYDLTLTDEDLAAIEKEMNRIVSEKIQFIRTEVPTDEALERFSHDRYKIELIEGLAEDSATVTIYEQAESFDLCRGPHLADSGKVGPFKLLRVSGAYWRGDSDNPQLTRIYGVSFPTREALDAELHRREEAEKRDHRKLGKRLELFFIPDAAPGAPIFLPNGAHVYNKLVDLKRELMRKWDYDEIRTPTVLKRELWEQSGHWDHYAENMFTLSIDEEDYAVKPMNCPGSAIAYKFRPRSYRDLPMRLAEFGYVHRYEMSGVMTGLLRVRAFTQDDAHLYITPSQIREEVERTIEFYNELYELFGFSVDIALSTRPPKKMGAEELWDQAENALRDALEGMDIAYRIKEGDGAFYGPKIDFQIRDTLGREWQCGTIQLDFSMPEKFDLTYVNEDGENVRPVMIHPAAMGSIERFMAVVIENFAGKFPTWMNPNQVIIIPISEKTRAYGEAIAEELNRAGFLASVDRTSETVGKKIRNAQNWLPSYIIVVGPKEEEQNAVSIRDREGKSANGVSKAVLLKMLEDDVEAYRQQPFLADEINAYS